jgi:hypothetical protein
LVSKRDAVSAALDLAEDIGSGKANPAELDRELVDTCRSLLGTVAGPDDPLWPLHVDVARQVLAAGGVPVDELQEWAAVLRQRGQDCQTPAGSRNVPTEVDSAASEPYSGDIGAIESEHEPEAGP